MGRYGREGERKETVMGLKCKVGEEVGSGEVESRRLTLAHASKE